MTVHTAAHPDRSQTSFGGEQLVTFRIADQVFGIPALKVRDVLRPQPITRVPLAPPAVSGSINLRGHIVTAVDVRLCLGFERGSVELRPMCIVVDIKGDSICLLVDSVGDVVSVNEEDVEPNPGSLQSSWAAISRGIFRLKDGLLVILDVDQLIAW